MEPQKKSSPLDVFIHISSIVLVYWISISFISLIFYFINNFFPDNLTSIFNYSSATIKWNLSLLVVLFPVYIYLSRFIIKDTDSHPEKSDLRVKKWLSYFTIFVALAAMIGVVISLIYNFLNGELTSRFSLKALTVFIVSVFTLWWLRFNLNRRPGEFPSFDKKLAYSGIVLISIGIICGFVSAGSPINARKLSFDQTRTYDLQDIQSQVIYYWQAKNVLPTSLSDLSDPIRGYFIPQDPETKKPYEYKVLGDVKFQLCADFNLDSSAQNNPQTEYFPTQELLNWNHPAGHSCFDRTIDKDFYPPIKK